MRNILSIAKQSLLVGAAAVLSFGLPAAITTAAYADPTPAPCVAPAATSAGVHQPNGASAGAFTYQCNGQYAGKWTSAYYVYDPATQATTPLYAPDYEYSCKNAQWTMVRYDYSPARGNYYASRVKADSTSNLPTNCPVVASTTPASTPVAPVVTTPTPATNSAGSTGAGISNTGNNSDNSTANGQTINLGSTNNNNLSANNGLNSQATSGNAGVTGNTIAGDATSGDAVGMATVANLLQSTATVFGPDTTTFTANINGDVNGDFMFDPSAIMGTGLNSTNSTDNTGKLTINQANNTDAAINNNIDVGATSGDAKVANNTEGGNATSGDATAIVNLMNLISSTVGAGKSFVGTININGDLNGDILLPQGLIDQMLASSGPGSDNSATTAVNTDATVTNNTTEGINNNITSSANSGDATVSGNTVGGNATTGSGKTNVTLLNLTGSSVTGGNDILVFVNVLGHWVGMIMNAPAGSTAAELGGGITGSGPNSTNATNTTVDANATVNNNANLAINNNVNAHAQTGDATVKDNTEGGNATSGDAKTAVNVLNIEGSNFDLSNWFGVLFINVFGVWNGSFGVNTSAGDPATGPASTTVPAGTQAAAASSLKQFANFAAAGSTSGSGSATGTSTDTQVLGSSTSTTVAKKVAGTTASLSRSAKPPHASFGLPIIGVILAGSILLFGERKRFFGNKK